MRQIQVYMVQCAQADDAVRIIIIDFLLPSSRQLEIWLLPVMEQRSRKKTNTKIKIGLENNLFFTNCRYNRLWYIYRDQSGKEKKYQQDVCMYEYVDAHETRQTIVGGKNLEFIS